MVVHRMVVVGNSTAVPHHPNFTADAISPEAKDAVLDGATVMALTALDAALDPALRAGLLELQASVKREPPQSASKLNK
jgi:hypothetical protein